MKLLKILENTKWQWIACLWMIFSRLDHLLSCYYIFVVKCVFHGFRWGPNAILTACIRRHIEKQGGKLDTNPLVSTTIIVTVWLTFFLRLFLCGCVSFHLLHFCTYSCQTCFFACHLLSIIRVTDGVKKDLSQKIAPMLQKVPLYTQQ